MTDFKFYIFGTPDGFDFFQGTTEEKNYFQMFYDGSSNGYDDKKLSIRRRDNGQIIYSFLCYNLTSEANRAGAFFGISVVSDKYCTDNNDAGLYGLFTHIFDIILQRGILLKSINNQIIFCIRYFKEAESEIKFITDLLLQNLGKYFDGKFYLPDNSFKQGVNLNVEMQLNNKAEDKTIVTNLREFPRLVLAPSFKGGIIKKVSDKEVLQLRSEINGIEKRIIELKEERNTLTAEFTEYSKLPQEKKNDRKNNYNKATKKYKNLLNDCNTAKQTIHEFRKIEANNFQKNEKDIESIVSDLESLKRSLSAFEDLILADGEPTSSSINNDDYFTLSVEVIPSEKGRVIGDDSYKKGMMATIIAKAELGYRFVNWTKNGVSVSTDVEYKFPMPAENLLLRANFTKKGLFERVIEKIKIKFTSKPSEKKHKTKLILTYVLTLILIAGGLVVYNIFYKSDNPIPDNSKSTIVEKGKDSINHPVILTENLNGKYWIEKAGNATTLQEQLSYLEKAKNCSDAYDINPNLENDIKTIKKQIVDKTAAETRKKTEEEAAKKAKENKKEDDGSIQKTYDNVIIKITSGQKTRYSTKDQFTVVATSGTTTCIGGEWKFGSGIWANKSNNPTIVEIKSYPTYSEDQTKNGKAYLYYTIDGKIVQTLEIKINME